MHARGERLDVRAAGRTPGRSGRGRGATARGRAGVLRGLLCWSPPRSCHVPPTRRRRPRAPAVTERDGRGEPSPVRVLGSGAWRRSGRRPDAGRSLPRRRAAGRRGHGPGVRRDRTGRAPRGRQGDPRRPRRRHRLPATVPAGGRRGLGGRGPVHRPRARRRPGRRAAVARHGVRRRAVAARGRAHPRADARARPGRPGPRARRGTGGDPRGRARPPRPEARQRAPLPRRAPSDRLRDRAGGRRVAAHRHRPDHRHAGLHGPRADRGPAGERPRRRRVRAGLDAGLGRDVARPVRGRPDRRHALPDHDDAARPARRAPADRGDRRGLPGQGPRGAADRGAARRAAAGGGRGGAHRAARRRDRHAAAGPPAGRATGTRTAAEPSPSTGGRRGGARRRGGGGRGHGGDVERLRDARAGPAAHPATQHHGGPDVSGPGQPAGPLRRPALRLGHAALDARLHRDLPHARQRSRAAQTGLPRGRRPHDRHRAGRAPRSHRAPGRGAERAGQNPVRAHRLGVHQGPRRVHHGSRGGGRGPAAHRRGVPHRREQLPGGHPQHRVRGHRGEGDQAAAGVHGRLGGRAALQGVTLSIDVRSASSAQPGVGGWSTSWAR